MLSRRTLLTSAGVTAATVGAVGVGVGLSRPWSDDAAEVSRATPDLAPAGTVGVPDVEIGSVHVGTFRSRHRLGALTYWTLIRPPGESGPLPVVVALHGLGGTATVLLDPVWGLPQFLAAAVADGVPPFAIATVSGGTGFWHRRPSGEDAGAMVVDELLPRLGRRGADLDRLGLMGWSMGGYGALRLAGLLGPERVEAVVACSPGLYTDPRKAHPDGFANPAEYRRFSVMDRQRDLDAIPLRVDIGLSDPFYEATRTYVGRFAPDADVTATFTPGNHDTEFAHRVLPAELAFLGERL